MHKIGENEFWDKIIDFFFVKLRISGSEDGQLNNTLSTNPVPGTKENENKSQESAKPSNTTENPQP